MGLIHVTLPTIFLFGVTIQAPLRMVALHHPNR